MLEELPEVLDRVEFRAVGRQRQEREAIRDQQGVGAVPAGLIEDDDGMGIGRDVGRDLGEVQVHGRGIDVREDQSGGLLGRRADGGEDIGGGVALVARLPRPAAAARPASAAPMLRLRSSGRASTPEGRVNSPFWPILASSLHEGSLVKRAVASSWPFPAVPASPHEFRVQGRAVPQPQLHHLTCGRVRCRSRTRMPHARGVAPAERDPPETRRLDAANDEDGRAPRIAADDSVAGGNLAYARISTPSGSSPVWV